MSRSAYNAYSNAQRVNETGAQTDAAVLEKAAQLLRDLKRDVTTNSWGDTLRYNQKIWTVIQTELTDPANTLPDNVKANIISLSVFVDKHTWNILWLQPEERNPQKLDVLININFNIAMGLRGDPGQGIPKEG